MSESLQPFLTAKIERCQLCLPLLHIDSLLQILCSWMSRVTLTNRSVRAQTRMRNDVSLNRQRWHRVHVSLQSMEATPINSDDQMFDRWAHFAGRQLRRKKVARNDVSQSCLPLQQHGLVSHSTVLALRYLYTWRRYHTQQLNRDLTAVPRNNNMKKRMRTC